MFYKETIDLIEQLNQYTPEFRKEILNEIKDYYKFKDNSRKFLVCCYIRNDNQEKNFFTCKVKAETKEDAIEFVGFNYDVISIDYVSEIDE